MKKLFFLACALLCVLPAWGAAKQLPEIPRNNFVAKKGDWNKARNWEFGRVPKDEYARIINASVLTLDAAVPEVESVIVGSRQYPSTLIVEKGADLKVRNAVTIWSNSEDGQARFHMKGGQIETATGKTEGAVYVGTGGTYAGTAIATLSGGKIIGSVIVGSTLQKIHTGKVVVEGSEPVIVAGPFAQAHFLVTPSGTVEFVFDENGVGCFDYAESPAGNRLMAGATIVVDGSKYKGGARVFPLFTAARMEDAGARVEVAGFAPGYETQILKVHRRVPGLYIKVSPVQ